MSQEPAIIRTERKITDARNWRGDVNVSLGDETVTFKHRLLNEGEFLDVKQTLNIDELSDDDNVGQTKSQERLLELQQKSEELTEDEEEELEELTREVAGQADKIEKALGEDGYDLLMELGRECIEPSDEDVDYVYNMPVTEMADFLNMESLPDHITRDRVEELMRERLRELVTHQPYPIKVNVGMQALSETLSVLGNGLPKQKKA